MTAFMLAFLWLLTWSIAADRKIVDPLPDTLIITIVVSAALILAIDILLKVQGRGARPR